MEETDASCIILIRPPLENEFLSTNPPIGLGYLASYLENAGFHVYILDLTIHHVSNDVLIQLIRKKRPLLVGLTSLTPYYIKMREISIRIKHALPGIPIVLGGVHPSSLPRESLIECEADYIVIGEGEETMLELASTMQSRGEIAHIAGIAYKKDSSVIINPTRALIADLDTIPFPSWFKIDPRKYPLIPHGFVMRSKYVAPIMSSRGCPFKCSYCASCRFWRQQIRFRSPKNVVDEMEYLNKHFGIKEFHFWDDNLTLRRENIIGICKEIISRKLRFLFTAPNGIRVDTLDKKLLKIMKMAGFYHLTFSVESASRKLLRENEKYTNLTKIARNTIIAKDLGFSLSSFFMIGFQNETAETIKKTIRFAKSLPFDIRLFFIMKPLPGSKLFESMAQKINLKDFDWNSITFFMETGSSPTLGGLSLLLWQKKAYREIILRFPQIIQFIWYRFIKYGHLYQMKYQLQRIFFVLSDLIRIGKDQR